MNYDMTEEQIMLKEMAKKFAENEMMPCLKEFERERKVNFDIRNVISGISTKQEA